MDKEGLLKKNKMASDNIRDEFLFDSLLLTLERVKMLMLELENVSKLNESTNKTYNEIYSSLLSLENKVDRSGSKELYEVYQEIQEDNNK